MIRDKMLERSGGNTEAKFMETVNGHLAENPSDGD